MSRTVMFDEVMRGGSFTYRDGATLDPPRPGFEWTTTGTSWKRGAAPNSLYLQEEIDIGGLTTTQEETFFPSAATIQNSPFYVVPGVVEGLVAELPPRPYGALFEYVLVTESPFKVDKWLGDQNYTIFNTSQEYITVQSCPGINPRRTTDQASTLGFNSILYGRVQMIVNNSSLPQQAGAVYQTNEFGSMTPTASDKLYVTRFVVIQPLGGNIIPDGSTIQLPHMRVIMVGSGKEENELSYIMRLRNSYLLQQDVN